MRRIPCWLGVVGLVLTLVDVSRADDAAGDEFFEREVRPILVEHCQRCHGATKPKAGLRLDSRAAILEGGGSGAAAIEGKPAESLLIEALHYRDEPRMPPDGKLDERQIETLSKWVAMGLPWPEASGAPAAVAEAGGGFAITEEQRAFWSFRPVVDPAAPAVRDGAWPRGEIDRFILAKLEAEGLSPALEAEKRALIRRATVDLTGLPPTPEEVEAFVGDESPEAFARVVDRLLDAPAYGQRWARHWLDVVRYADSLDARGSGQPGDILDAWRYRDWVVDALNADLPYDQFIKMQVAGDVIGARTGAEGFDRGGTIATTMLAIGNWGNGDADKEKILTDIADDQVDVVSKAFLGLTVACARCHDHKFDPIGQEDYYGLAGIFFSTHILPKLTPKGAGETIARVALASPAELARRDEQARRLAELEATIGTTRAAMGDALAERLRPEAGRYVLAAWDSVNGSPGAATGLESFAVRRWIDALGGTEAVALSKRIERIGGNAGVDGWNTEGPGSSVSANATDQTLMVLTFTLPARSVSVHPGPESSAVAAWRSPIGGLVRVGGRVADGDVAGGDGVAWSVEHRGPGGTRVLATGEVANGGAMRLEQGAGADRLASVAVRPGERIELVIHRRAEYTCDTTTIELAVAAADGSEDWSLTRDCVDRLSATNPLPDQSGRAGVWTFGDVRRSGPGAESAALVAARERWRGALEAGGPLEEAAALLGAALTAGPGRSPFQIETVADEAALPEADRAVLGRLRGELEALRAAAPPPLEYANAAQEGGVPESPHAGCHDVAVHLRGRYERLGPVVRRRFPIILAGEPAEQAPITEGSGRKELAEWLASESNPLTARVMVNRIWQHHFGAGLVRTPSNFGKLGERPTHPELLDWLAARFVEDGWSIKAMHRRIMLSSTYRQSSVGSALAMERDPENRWLGRMSRRRLESEALRDHLLAASGTLDARAGGPEVRDFNAPRRGLYVVTIRSDRATYGSLFDQADPTAPVERRVESTVAPQALFLLNNAFVRSQAAALGARVIREGGAEDRRRIERAYALLFARGPSEVEVEVGLGLLGEARRAGESDEAAWAAYAHVLLCTNEMMYVD